MRGGFAAYLRTCPCDFALSWVLAASASGLVASGFVSGDAWLAAPAALLCVPLAFLVVLYACSYNRRTVVAGLFAVPALALAALSVAAGAWDGGAVFEDAAGNPCPPLLATAVATVASYLLTRSRPGTVVLAFCGVLAIGYLQFVYKEHHALLALAFFAGCLAMLAWRLFSVSRRASSQGMDVAGRAFALCCVAAVALVAACAGVHAALIAPLDPPTVEVKLIKEYLALPQLDLRGVADQAQLEDPDRQSTRRDGSERQSSGQGGAASDGDEGAGAQQAPIDGASQDAYSPDEAARGYSAAWHEQLARMLAWPALLVLLAALAVAAKLQLRKRWFSNARRRPRAECVAALYRRWLRCFRRMRVPRRAFHTPGEFARASAEELEAFVGADGSSFQDVTGVFECAVYGCVPVDDAALAHMEEFHRAFYRNCRAYLGTPRYLLLFFAL